MAAKAGVALRFDCGEGRADNRIIVEIKLEGSFQLPAGAGVGIYEAVIGACPGPVGIKVPYVHVAGGVIPPEDFIGSADRFGSEHLPGGAGAASAGGRSHDGDRCDRGANAGVGLAITTAQQCRIPFTFKCGVIIEDCAYNCSLGADAVAAACGKGECNGFVWLNLNIIAGIHRDAGGGCSSGKDHRLGGGRGGDAGVIRFERGSAAHGVVHRQAGCGGPSSGEGVDNVVCSILADKPWRYSKSDAGEIIIVDQGYGAAGS